MLESSYKKYETIPFTISFVIFVAFVGVAMTSIQVILTLLEQETLCLNSGCKIVEGLTAVSPLVMNLAGMGYFAVVFFVFLQGRKGRKFWLELGRLLLLCGIAAEGMLVFFQYAVAGVFCSYCLIVCATIVLLNVLLGFGQLFQGLCLFVTVIIVCLALGFQVEKSKDSGGLEQGSIAILQGKNNEIQLFLLFSENCPHCKEVLASIDQRFLCTLHFNPVHDLKKKIALSGLKYQTEYSSQGNKRFLQNLGITQIPTLVVQEHYQTTVLTGTQRILAFFADRCREKVSENFDKNKYIWGQSQRTRTGRWQRFLKSPAVLHPSDDETCATGVDCDDAVSR